MQVSHMPHPLVSSPSLTKCAPPPSTSMHPRFSLTHARTHQEIYPETFISGNESVQLNERPRASTNALTEDEHAPSPQSARPSVKGGHKIHPKGTVTVCKPVSHLADTPTVAVQACATEATVEETPVSVSASKYKKRTNEITTRSRSSSANLALAAEQCIGVPVLSWDSLVYLIRSPPTRSHTFVYVCVFVRVRATRRGRGDQAPQLPHTPLRLGRRA